LIVLARGWADLMIHRCVLICGGGFLLSVLWMDLLFDSQVVGESGPTLSDQSLSSIRHYYQRIQTDKSPLLILIAGVMLVTILTAVYDLVRAVKRRGWQMAALFSSSAPIVFAQLVIIPQAALLGSGQESLKIQSELARSIFLEHLVCIASITVFLAIQFRLAQREVRSRDA
jgi:hypothetical protein